MSRHKGMSSKGQLTTEDLAELADIHARLMRMMASLNIHATATFPLMAAAATVKAAWAEVSGIGWAWSVPVAGLPKGGPISQEPVKRNPMRPIGELEDRE